MPDIRLDYYISDFISAQVVIFDNCHKDFIYNLLHTKNFANLTTVYLNSDIGCHLDIFDRDYWARVNLYLTPKYHQYKTKLFPNDTSAKKLSYAEYKHRLKEYGIEEHRENTIK
jgi:hypothetical protein